MSCRIAEGKGRSGIRCDGLGQIRGSAAGVTPANAVRRSLEQVSLGMLSMTSARVQLEAYWTAFRDVSRIPVIPVIPDTGEKSLNFCRHVNHNTESTLRTLAAFAVMLSLDH